MTDFSFHEILGSNLRTNPPKYSIFSWYSDHFWIWVKKKVCTTFEVLIDRVRRWFLVHRPFRQFPTAQNSNFWKFYFFHIFWLSDISVHLEKSAIFHKISCFFDLSHILEVPKIEKKSKFSKNWILGCWKFSKVHAYQKSWVKSIGNYMKSCAHFFFHIWTQNHGFPLEFWLNF